MFEFNNSDIGITPPLVLSFVDRIRRSLLTKIMLNSFRLYRKGEMGLTDVLKCWVVTVKEYMNQSPLEPIVIHNDLFGPNNVLTSANGNLYFYDFESVKLCKRWVLKDIVEISINRNELKLNFAMIGKYLEQHNEHNRSSNNININAQIRVILINRMIHVMMSKASVNSFDIKRKYKDFLLNVLLNDNEYTKWLDSSCYSQV